MGLDKELEEYFKHGKVLMDRNLAEKRGVKPAYNIAILGLGEQGRKLADDLAGMRKFMTFPEINSVCLLSSSEQEFLKTKLEVICNKNPMKIQYEKRDKLEDLVHEFDICVITADNVPDGISSDNRIDYTKDNLPMIRVLAARFPKDFLGNVVIVTNPTDLMAYAFAQYSGMDPRRIMGLNHLDTMRFRSVIAKNYMEIVSVEPDYPKKASSKNSEPIKFELQHAYAIGSHQTPFPFMQGIKINGIPLGNVIPQISKLEEQFDNFLHEYKEKGKDIIKDNPRTFSKEETGWANCEVIASIMLGNQGEITGSIPIRIKGGKIMSSNDKESDGELIYTGAPVDVEPDDSPDGRRGFHFEVKKGFTELLEKSDKDHKRFWDNIEEFREHVRKLKVNGELKKEHIYIPEQLRRKDTIRKEEMLVFGASGESYKVYAWDLMGNSRLSFDSIINGEKKFASCIKVFEYMGENYVAIGTSSGIIIRSLESPRFKSNLLIPLSDHPDGYVGHIRAIEIAGDKIIGSNYHVEFPKDVRQCSTGKGLYETDLDAAMKKERVTLYNVFPGMPGPLTKLLIDGQEAIVFPHTKELLKYVPIHGGTSQLYTHDEIITAISRDGRAIGDSKGNVVLFDPGFENPVKIKANHTGVTITALEHIVESGEHLLMGDSRSYFIHSQIKGKALQEGLYVPASRIDPNARGASALIKPVNDIKYFKINGNGMVFVASGQEVSSISLKDLIAGKEDEFNRAWNKDRERSIFSLDFYQGVVEK